MHTWKLKEYSEICGWFKHLFKDSVTPIGRYSLIKLVFKIPVGYDFMLARYAEITYTFPLNTVLFLMPRDQKFKNA